MVEVIADGAEPRVGLPELYAQHRGKVSDKWLSYLEFYDELFTPLRDAPLRILEIGIQNGGSLEIWAKYFPNAKCIVGCDIANEAARLEFKDRRISVVVGDANLSNTVAKIESLSPEYDLIIDDGSHRSDDIVRSFSIYFHKLAENGLYIAEDLHCAYWENFEGGIEAPFSSINFFKRLADLVNREHWGNTLASDAILNYFSERYCASFAASALDRVKEVRFRNSICVVSKGQEGDNEIGPRKVVGTEALVEPTINTSVDGMKFVGADQSRNPYGPGSVLLESASDAYSDLIKKVSEEQMRTVEINAMLASLDKSVRELTETLVRERRQPLMLLRRLTLYRAARSLAKLKVFPETIRDKLSKSSSENNPLKIVPSQLEKKTLKIKQSLLRRAAFHRSGKPRGWLRSIALQVDEGRIRPTWRRVFYKKNGLLRPDFANFLRTNLSFIERFPELRQALPLVSSRNTGLMVNPEEAMRQLFESQQAELTYVDARDLIDGLAHQPLISIIMPVYNTPPKWLHRVVESLQQQYYHNWELCVVDDCSPKQDQRELLRKMAMDDARIRLTVMPQNSGISAASNSALEMARGEFLALVDHDDEITPDALLRMVEAINRNPEADFLYSDECKIDDTSARRLFDFILKPDWSPEIMLNFMITGHLTVYRTDIVRQIGGFRSEYDFSQDYDLALRMGEVSRSIVHIERILYLWRAIAGSAASGGKDYARKTNIQALSDALRRRGVQGAAISEKHANRVSVILPRTGTRVSIVIPSDSTENLRLALNAIRAGTDYNNYEIRVVCKSSVAELLEMEYQDWPAVHFVRYDKPYNFSDKCNVGAEAAEGDILVFYNDDVFPISRDWIERLIEYLWLPDVGATSPQLLYEDGTIQYAGMISGTPGLAGTAYHRLPLNHTDDFLSMNRLVRNISILSGACCAMRRDLFRDVGGFDEQNTPDGHSDLDISFKILAKGQRCVYTPYSLLTHIGNHSWNAKAGKYKADIYCLKRWGSYISRDPYFSESMCRALYTDFTYEYRIHAEHIDPNAEYIGPDVLFVAHQLTNTGAPHMVLEAARAVKAAGGFPVVVAPADGPLRKAFVESGIVVIVDASITANHFLFERFARNFDIAVVNTSVMGSVVEQLAKLRTLRILWWLHESQSLTKNLKGMTASVWETTRVICVSDYAKQYLPKQIEGTVLLNGLPDNSAVSPHPLTICEPRKLVFVLIGTVEPRKGQDILVDAILGLPEKVRADCHFLIAGMKSYQNRPFWSLIDNKIKDQPDVSCIGAVSPEEALALIAGCDVLVSCSRDEAFSLVSIEAAQMGKPLILSDHVGANEVFDNTCAFNFPSENVDALRDCIIKAHADRKRLNEMGRAARQTYEKKLTKENFAQNFITLIEEELLIDPLESPR